MNHAHVTSVIEDTIRRIVVERGGAPVETSGDTAQLGGAVPIDSLNLATIVVELEGQFGVDPFKDGFIDFKTIGETAALYVAAV
jgi:acyl carrier protein